MPDGWNIGTIAAVITAIGGFLAVFIQGRRNKSDAIKMINESYSDLCAQFRSRIDQLHADLKNAEARIAVLEAENRELRKALADSEKERERLQGEVDDLSTRLAVYESRPQRTSTKRAQ